MEFLKLRQYKGGYIHINIRYIESVELKKKYTEITMTGSGDECYRVVEDSEQVIACIKQIEKRNSN